MAATVGAIILSADIWTGYGSAQDAIFRGSDGSTGAITHLGDHQAIFRDAHGNSGRVHRPGGESGSSVLITPQGEIKSGTVTPFGSPVPPSHLTPAPVLPLNPRMGVSPAPPTPPVVPMIPSGRFGTGRR